MACIDDYVAALARLQKEFGFAKDSNAAQKASERILKRESDLALLGKKFSDVNPNTQRTFGDEIYDAEIKQYLTENIQEGLNRTTDDAITDLTFKTVGLKNTIREFYPKKSEAEAIALAKMSLLVDTNFSYNTHSLETTTLAEMQSGHGDFYNRLQEQLPEFDLESMMRNETFVNELIDEYIIMINVKNWPTARLKKLDTTTMPEAHVVARTFIEEGIELKNIKMNAYGREATTIFQNKMRVDMTADLVKEKFANRNLFAEFMIKHIDETAYRNQNIDPKQLMGDVYDSLIKGDIKSWREIDNFIKKYDEETNIGQKSTLNGIEYKDGAGFRAVSDAVGYTKDVSQMMLNTMRYNSQLVALTKVFGPNPILGFNQFKKSLYDDFGNRLEGLPSVLKTQLDGVLDFVEQKINPDIMERSGVVPVFTTIRRIQSIGKLGSAVITSLLDVPVFLFTGRKMFGQDWNELFSAVFNVVPFVHDRKDQTKFASYFLEFSESWLDSARDRLGLVDASFLNAAKGGSMQRKISNGAAWYSNKIFQLSGLNYWTKNLQAGAAGVYVKSFGNLIDGNVEWKGIHERFRAQLQRYGVTENDWKFLLDNKKDILDHRGRLDMYKLGRVEINTKNNIIGETNLRDKIVASVSDSVNTMIIKPGEFDRLGSALYQDSSGLVGQLMKSITQFKTQPISYTRKVYMRHFQRNLLQQAGVNPGVLHYMSDATMLIGGLTLMSMFQLQTKQLVAGKSLYDMTTPTFWTEVVNQGGYLGLLQDLPMNMGLRELITQGLSDEPEKFTSSAETYDRLLGPIITDSMKLLQGLKQTATGGIRYAKDISDEELFKTGVSGITGLFGQYTGFKNFLFTKLLYRKYLTEHMSEWFNGDAYRKSQSRIQDEADENRKGKPNNWLFEKLP
jgi:hypothetical protein